MERYLTDVCSYDLIPSMVTDFIMISLFKNIYTLIKNILRLDFLL